jgi:hypothetical protein
MDTNPEEFDDYSGKWGDIIGAVHARKSIPETYNSKDNHPLPFLTDPEVNALYEKLEDVRRENFTADVLRRLADTPKEIVQEDLFDSATYSTTNHPLTLLRAGTATGTATWGKSSITTAQALSLDEAQKEELVRALDEYRKDYVKEKKQKATPR